VELLDQIEKRILKNLGHKMKLKRGDLKTRMKGNLTATVWKGG